MDVNIKQHHGVWTLCYSLDKHSTRSTPIGYNEFGHMQFDTVRPEAGETLFQLKYRSDYSQVSKIAQQMNTSFKEVFRSAGLVIPMPSSKARTRQPVTEIAREVARLKGIPCYENLLIKTGATSPMKDITSKQEKVDALRGGFYSLRCPC